MFSARSMRKTGWIFFRLIWLPFIGIFVGMMGTPDGSYDWIELPLITRYSLVATGILMVLAMFFIFGSTLFSSVQNRELLENGQSAKATILNIEPTGTTVNDYYHGMSFLLDVQPLNEPPFQARVEKLVPMHMMAQYQIGNVIEIKFDPKSQTVAIPDGSLVQG